MASPAQTLLAALWWSPLRRPFEAVARRLWRRRRILSGPLRGLAFDGGLAQRLGIYELPVQEALWRLLEPGDVVYDVGGHRGFVALLAARRVGRSGCVFVFEPVEESRRAVEEAVEENGLGPVETFPAAVSDREGEAELFVREATTVASLLPDGDARRRTVALLTLDAFAADHPPPDLVKIDVEGAEDRVLMGARRLLEGKRPHLVVELHGPELERAVRELLAARGYVVRPLPRRSSRGVPYPRHIVAESPERRR